MSWYRNNAARTWLVWIMLLVLIVSLVSWLIAFPRRHDKIVIATAQPEGQYFKFGTEFQAALDKQAGRDVEVAKTLGSVDNRIKLLADEVDLAIIQTGSVSLNQMAVVAPLHRDVIYVVVRKNSGIKSINDLENRAVILGPEKSGMRSSAMHILGHYGLLNRIDDQGQIRFDQINDEGNQSIEAAIVTTGLDNSSMRELLRHGEFELLPINARAIAAERSFFREFELPRGFFSEQPLIPDRDIQTVATTALLVVREDAPSDLVRDALDALYKEDFQASFPYLISHEEASMLPPMRLHPAARRYFDPFDRVGWLAAIIETLAATKELLFALGAGLFLCWHRWRRLREKEEDKLVQDQKDRLDAYMQRTFDIERQQMDLLDTKELQKLLDEVTKTKLGALEELTHQKLRANQDFSIFHMQCANLINKIQLKIITYLNVGDRE